MPIQWTEKKTTERQCRLIVGTVEENCVLSTHPATLDDLSAAIRGLSPGDRALLLQLTPIEPCLGCKKTMGDMERDLVDARNALEIARAEAERLRAKLEARTQELDNQKAEIDRQTRLVSAILERHAGKGAGA